MVLTSPGESISTYWSNICLALAAILSAEVFLYSSQAIQNAMFSWLNSDFRKALKAARPTKKDKSFDWYYVEGHLWIKPYTMAICKYWCLSALLM